MPADEATDDDEAAAEAVVEAFEADAAPDEACEAAAEVPAAAAEVPAAATEAAAEEPAAATEVPAAAAAAWVSVPAAAAAVSDEAPAAVPEEAVRHSVDEPARTVWEGSAFAAFRTCLEDLALRLETEEDRVLFFRGRWTPLKKMRD